MSLQIPILGVEATFRTPGIYASIEFAQGPASAAAGVREVLLVMPMTSSGTWTANTLYAVPNEATARTGAGTGSPLHRAARKFLRTNQDAKLWALPYAASSGGSPATATGTVTFASGPASATGTATVTVCGEDCSFTYPSGATVTDIAAGIVATINAREHLPVVASNVSGVVTLTARIAGASQGTATIGVIRFRASITSGTSVTVATSGAFVGSGTAGADGTTTEAANFATALAAIEARRFYFIVTSLWDATSLGHLKTHIVLKSEPRRGLRSVGIAGYTSSLSNVSTIANGRNYERLQIAWQPNSEHDTAEIAGAIAAVRQKEEQVDTAFNFDGYSLNDILLPAYSSADWPDADDQSDAINDGVTPIASTGTGTYIVMSVNTRSKNSTGAVDDFRATETHRVSVCDEFVDEELAQYALEFAGKKLEDDLRLADGTVDVNQPRKRNVVTPSGFRPHLTKRMDNFAALGKLQNIAASKASLRVIKTGSRLECGFDLNVIDLLHQATLRVSEVSTG
jgi:phage tail sheath gpL-like